MTPKPIPLSSNWGDWDRLLEEAQQKTAPSRSS